MKKILVIMLCVLTTLSVRAGQDKPIEFKQLPQSSQEFINTHFANTSIALVKMERELFSKSYEVIFTNGSKIEFNGRGVWQEVDCGTLAVPAALIPAKINAYLRKHYPETQVVQLEKERRNGLEVELSTGMSLEFDAQMNVIDINS